MKKQITVILFMLVFFLPGRGQNLPNSSFENWETRILYEEPTSWTTGNMLAFMFQQTVASKTSDSYQGEYALRLDTRVTDETIPGFAFSDGMITTGNMDDGFQFTGGIPVSGTPTQMSGYFKYDIPFLDVGIIMIAFKKDGAAVGQVIEPLLFSAADYTRIDIDISGLSDVPDSAFIAFATTNPDDPQTGGWIQVDSLWFSGISDPVPNGNFEDWEDAAYYEPTDWLTTNLFAYLFGGDTSATRTEDAYTGDYAIRIECIETVVPDDDGMINAHMGYMMPYDEEVNLNETMPAFPVDFNPTGLEGFYKFFPAENDTALIMAILNDEEGISYELIQPLLATSEYSPINFNFNYPNDVTIESVSIIANTSLYFDPNNTIQDLGEIGSVLFLDDLELANDCYTSPFTIEVLQEASCDNDTAILDAGDSWGSIFWSTGDTTQQLKVSVSEELMIHATVTATDSWCAYMDTVWLVPPEGCEDQLQQSHSDMEINIYPNPGNGSFMISLPEAGTETCQLEVFSQTGQLVYRKTLQAGQQVINIDLNDLQKGLYHLKIKHVDICHHKTFQIR